jgi:hypothetical protein
VVNDSILEKSKKLGEPRRRAAGYDDLTGVVDEVAHRIQKKGFPPADGRSHVLTARAAIRLA